MLITCEQKPEKVKRDGPPKKLTDILTIQMYVGTDGPEDDRIYVHNETTGEWQRVVFPETPPEPGISLAADGYYRLALPLWGFEDPGREPTPAYSGAVDVVFVMVSPEMASGWLRVMDSIAQFANELDGAQKDQDEPEGPGPELHVPDYTRSAYFDFTKFAALISEDVGTTVWPNMGSCDGITWLPSQTPDMSGRGAEVNRKTIVFTPTRLSFHAYRRPDLNYYKNPNLLCSSDELRRETIEQMAKSEQLPARYELPWHEGCFNNSNYEQDQ